MQGRSSWRADCAFIIIERALKAMERAYSPYYYFVSPVPGALPQADMVRAFGASSEADRLLGATVRMVSGIRSVRRIQGYSQI